MLLVVFIKTLSEYEAPQYKIPRKSVQWNPSYMGTTELTVVSYNLRTDINHA
jgi:hypothetical protein